MDARSTTLTPREWEVLDLIARGQRCGQVAASLCISPHTVAAHCRMIRLKLGASTVAHAVYKALGAAGNT